MWEREIRYFMWKWNLYFRGEFPSCLLIPGNWAKRTNWVCVNVCVPVRPLKIPDCFLRSYLKFMQLKSCDALLLKKTRKRLVCSFYYEECALQYTLEKQKWKCIGYVMPFFSFKIDSFCLFNWAKSFKINSFTQWLKEGSCINSALKFSWHSAPVLFWMSPLTAFTSPLTALIPHTAR